MKYSHAQFTYAIPGYWLQDAVTGEHHFSSDGHELTEEGKRLCHSFPTGCDKALEPRHLVEGCR